MTDGRDAERLAVYAAEAAAFDGTDIETVVDFDLLVDAIDAVTAGEWWPGPAVAVVAARRDASSSSTRDCAVADGGPATIRIAAEQCTIATAAHELAHAVAGVAAGHGPTFRAAMLDVLTAITNRDPTDRRRDLHTGHLRDAFAAAGLAVGERRWPPPSPSTGGAIAL